MSDKKIKMIGRNTEVEHDLTNYLASLLRKTIGEYYDRHNLVKYDQETDMENDYNEYVEVCCGADCVQLCKLICEYAKK